MIVNNFYLRVNFYFCFFTSIFYMYMDGQMFVKIEEEPDSKYCQKCRHDFIFICKYRYKILYLQCKMKKNNKKVLIYVKCLLDFTSNRHIDNFS